MDSPHLHSRTLVPYAAHAPQTLRAAVSHQSGFTMVELMVTMMILAILVAIAAPSFTPLLERWRTRNAAEALQSSLYLARSEAIKRGGNVSMAKVTTQDGCTATASDENSTSSDWSCGWTVLVDTNQNGAVDAGQTPAEEVLQRIAPLSGVSIGLDSGQSPLLVDRWGVIRSTNSTSLEFQIRAKGASSDTNMRVLCLSSGGRITQHAGSDASC